ncbi:hypothetical protein Vafri_2277 [Volvox africanus]|nr:hypothetical protein Vafri_2277 [Volvox africanus]
MLIIRFRRRGFLQCHFISPLRTRHHAPIILLNVGQASTAAHKTQPTSHQHASPNAACAWTSTQHTLKAQCGIRIMRWRENLAAVVLHSSHTHGQLPSLVLTELSEPDPLLTSPPHPGTAVKSPQGPLSTSLAPA